MAQTTSSSQTITYTTDAGLRLVGDAWGASAAPPVLLLHGGGQTRHAWGTTAQSLAERGWYAVSLDMRGHGDSDWAPDGNYTIDAFVADLHSVIRRCTQRPERSLAAARALRVPTLLVRGKLSDIVSDATQAEFLAAVPHAAYVDVAGAGHMVAGDQNDTFSKGILDFLARL